MLNFYSTKFGIALLLVEFRRNLYRGIRYWFFNSNERLIWRLISIQISLLFFDGFQFNLSSYSETDFRKISPLFLNWFQKNQPLIRRLTLIQISPLFLNWFYNKIFLLNSMKYCFWLLYWNELNQIWNLVNCRFGTKHREISMENQLIFRLIIKYSVPKHELIYWEC